MPEQLRPRLRLVSGNQGEALRGLPAVYNEAIQCEAPGSILVFCHDDVYLNDWFVVQRVREALGAFDVVGLAGSQNPDLAHPSWGLRFDESLAPQGWQEGLVRSGAVNHFDYACPNTSVYGDTPAECQLLDGLFLAARVDVLRDAGVTFDEAFMFHLYDLDFCRTARAAGLQLGTWPIAVTHNSGGAFESSEFRSSARRYLEKWRE